MKTSKKMRALILFVLCITGVKAQTPNCNYIVDNSGPCNIIVTVDFYDNTNQLCNSSGNVILSQGQTQFQCNCPGGLIDVVVTLISIGGVAPSGGNGYVDVTSQTDGGSFASTPPSCSTGNYTMSWGAGGTAIGY